MSDTIGFDNPLSVREFGKSLQTPRGRIVIPVSRTIAIDIPAAGAATGFIELYKVPTGFRFDSTKAGLMIDTLTDGTVNVMSLYIFALANLEVSIRTNGKVHSEFSIDPTSWPINSAEPEEFLVTCFQNEVIDINIRAGGAWAFAKQDPHFLARIQGYLTPVAPEDYIKR